MCRHSSARQALIEKTREGAMGEITLIRAYRMDPGARMGPFQGGESELLWQIRRPYFFLWVSSAWFIEMMIHQVDECCWIKDAWPVSAEGLGGCEPRSDDCSQNVHSYAIEYTFGDGTKAFVNSRNQQNCRNDFATFVHGTKCAAQFSGNVHAPTVQIHKDQRISRDNIAWRPDAEKVSPYQAEWDALLDAIRNDKPYNEVQRAAYTNLASIMGRAAIHTGQIVTWEQMMASNFKFCPCLLYTSDAADDLLCVNLGGRRIIKKKTHTGPQVWRTRFDPRPSYGSLTTTLIPVHYCSRHTPTPIHSASFQTT